MATPVKKTRLTLSSSASPLSASPASRALQQSSGSGPCVSGGGGGGGRSGAGSAGLSPAALGVGSAGVTRQGTTAATVANMLVVRNVDVEKGIITEVRRREVLRCVNSVVLVFTLLWLLLVAPGIKCFNSRDCW